MKRNPERTRQPLLEAGTAELAAYGIAGARGDRIAEAAGCNKQLIYGYFDSKEGLFDAVYDAMVVQTISTIAMDPRDLSDYAGRLFDWYRAHPEVLRLATWRQLEKGLSTEMSRTTAKGGLEKVRKRLSMVQLDEGRLDRKSRETLRSGLVESVRRLVAP